jgi:transposase
MANGNMDGGAAPDLSAGGRGLSGRFEGCGVGAAEAPDPTGVARRAIAQDQHAGGAGRDSLSAAHRCRWRYLPRDGFPPRSTVYNIFRKFQREGMWKAIWAELHMALRERMGCETSPSPTVLDNQSVKSAEKEAAKTTRWVTTPARR